MLPKDWNPSCKLLANTGSSNSLTEAASIQISPTLTASIIKNSIATTSLCYCGSVRFLISGKVSSVETRRLITIQNFLRPYFDNVYL